MYLSQIRIVDLTRSVWDKEKSRTQTGEYIFSRKEFVNYNDKSNLPPYFFKWIRYTPRDNYMDVDMAKWEGFSYVTANDPYWPEPLKPEDGHGFYRFADVVLMKCPLIDELKRRKLSKDMSESHKRQAERQFREEMEAKGAALTSADEDELQKMAKALGVDLNQ